MIKVKLYYPLPTHCWHQELQLPLGSVIQDAIKLSLFQQLHPTISPEQLNLAIYGKLVGLNHLLKDGDRIDILRPLKFDPKESRRRRALHKKNNYVPKKK